MASRRWARASRSHGSNPRRSITVTASRDRASPVIPEIVPRQTTTPPSVGARRIRRAERRISVRRLLTSAVFCVGLALPAASARAQHPLVSLPLDDPAYPLLDGLVRGGCQPARISAYRPYLVRDVRAAVRRATTDSSCASSLVAVLRDRFASDTFDIFTDNEGVLTAGGALTVRATQLSNGEFRPLWRGLRPKAEGDPPVSATVQGRVTWGSKNVVGVIEGVGYTHRRNDPNLHQRAVRSTSGAIDFGESYVNAQLGKWFTLSFGRASEAWLGEGRESLTLSAWGPALDRIELSGRWRRVEARALVATLASVEMDPAVDSLPPGSAAHRFYRQLIGHALTIRPTRAVELSLGETILIARGTQTLELAYMNPLMAYVVTQNDTSRYNTTQGDNLQVFGGARLHSGASAVQAELLVDDVQIDPKDRRKVQDQLAWSVRGTQGLPFLVPASAIAEYRHVNSYAYLRNFYATAYQSYDAPIGSELGPDADLWRLGGELWPAGTVQLTGGLSGWRQGAQRIDQRTGRNSNNHAGEPYPSVTPDRPGVQRTVLVDAGASYLKHPLTFTARVEAARVRNPNNQLTATASYVRLQLIGRYAYQLP